MGENRSGENRACVPLAMIPSYVMPFFVRTPRPPPLTFDSDPFRRSDA